MVYRRCLTLAATLTVIIVSASATYNTSNANCQQCYAHGQVWEPNKPFTYQENCREYMCKCRCDGTHECPPERVETICQPSNPQCGRCWAGGAMQDGNKAFKFTEGCHQYNCFCNCDGAWNCPPADTIDICSFNVTSGCHRCDVYGVMYEGNSHFKHVNGCIEYDCTCKCDGGWNCPGERAVDTCNQNPDTGCYYCKVYGKRYEGNSHFVHTNGCIEYQCTCNCDGSWDCPGNRAIDTCRTNRTTGCYYCDVYGYLYEGNTQFPLIKDCFQYKCDCNCDGGWTCKHSIGEYVCDAFGNEPISECRSCLLNNEKFRGESRFYYQKGCVTYKCSCDCGGRYYCPGNEAWYTCPSNQGQQIASLSSSYTYVYTEHTRSPRQIGGCLPCKVDSKTYDTYQTFTKQIGCNEFRCTCQCNGKADCPPSTAINRCLGPTGGGSGASTFGSEVDPQYTDLGTGINICLDCDYRGITYTGNTPFSFESYCWRYNCMCNCNGSISCPSDQSKYVCPGRKECIKCKVDSQIIDPNTDFQLRRGCVNYEKCRCNCDGGWTCDDGEYTCDLCQGCKVDGRSYAGNSSFVLTRGCDRYKSCYCGCDSKWQCSGVVEDLCGACRKCKIGLDYYDGDTSFSAQVGCTRYASCTCNCDGSYKCLRGVYTCDERGDLPVEDQCTNCVHDGRQYIPNQRFDYEDSCVKYKDCTCKCGKTTCKEEEDTCGNCRSCLVDSTEYRGGTKFSKRNDCLHYKECDCFCSGEWKCYGESAVDTCNTCKKCNVDDVIYDPYSRFNLERDCWRYHCFCGCDGSTRCPSQTAVNTCTQPDVCYTCEAGGQEYRGNSLFTYDHNGITSSCKCNCDGSYFCIAEWLYIKTDLSISGADLGGCFYCSLDGRTFRGDTNFTIVKDGIDMNCQCFCNGGYYCYGEKSYESTACRGCSLYGLTYAGDTEFPLVYNGLKLVCQCSCDGKYLCYGTEGTAVISCIKGVGCLTGSCGQCVVQGKVFNGGDVFGSTYKGRDVRCDCGCDGSYYCEGSGGIILSCVGGFCREFGCTSCEVFDLTYPGDTEFEIVHRGLDLDCNCECGGDYRCMGSSGEVIVTCISGVAGCLPTGTCNMCLVNNKRYAGRSTFRYDYNGVEMLCTCSCDGSWYCKGVYELIEISCIGGTCTRIGCKPCNVYGVSYDGASNFDLIYGGLKLGCRCECTSDYVCMGSTGNTVISCIGGRNCLPATCGTCFFNNRQFAGRSTFRSQYKGIDILCTCGCDSTAYCTGTTTSVEIMCVGGTCSRIGCRECSIFGKEYLGSSQFDIVYAGQQLTCSCDCEGGYICRTGTGSVIVTCVGGVGAGCLTTRCGECTVGRQRYPGFSTFDHVYQGVDMKCSCSCDGSYYCEGVSELIEISCVGGTCTPMGCKQCTLYDKQIPGATPFQLIYGGYELQCKCNCDGSYKCIGEGGVTVLQCNYNMNCLPSRCQGCNVNNVQYRGGDTFRDVYNGIDVMCTCGCDSSYLCTGVSTTITVVCVGGRCNVAGCQGCTAYGRRYASFEKFETYYRGMRLSCDCACDGGYVCTGSSGEVFVRCRDGQDCLGPTCNSCSFNNRVIPGLSVFKYDYNGIDMSCTCGCDGNVFCFGVTESIELICVGGSCRPSGCRSCIVQGTQIEPFSTFTAVHGGKQLDCTCNCDSSFRCLYKSDVVINCPAGQGDTCFGPTCRECIADGQRHRAGSTFPYKFEDIDMTCTCGCDGSSYCTGIRVDIIVSCVGGTCSPLDCKACNIFGSNYQAYQPFRIVHQGVWLDCSCACDSSFVCRGKSGNEVVNCRPGESCFPSTCKECVVDGRRFAARSVFPYSYEGMAVSCNCGCDGTAICEGTQTEIILTCIGGSCAPYGCKDCVLFGRSYKPFRPFQIIYEASQLDCTCSCDSSFVCYGESKNEVINCRPGQNCPTSGQCRDCLVGGVTRESRSVFAYQFGNIDMKCSCGCDGSAYCQGVTEQIIVRCIGGQCSVKGCRKCNIFGREHEPYNPFKVVHEGTQLDCTCKCDSSFVCTGRSGDTVVDCKVGQNCFPSACNTDCVVGGRSYRPRSTFQHRYNNIDLRCTCGCDATSYCEGVSQVYYVSCIGQRCFPVGCEGCNLFGVDYPGDSTFNIVYKGLQMDCQCNCDTSWICRGQGNDIDCKAGQRCLPKRCRKCRVGNTRYDGNAQFQFEYKNTQMNCICGCDGTYYCKGVSSSLEITCSRRGDCKQIGGCQDCRIFGNEYHGGTKTEFVYQGYIMSCECNCDTSFKCIGTKGNTIVDCAIGQNCLINSCGPCRVGANTYRGGDLFDFVYNRQNMQCTCGCDGSFFCRGRDDGSEYSCTALGVCTRVGCNTCVSDGRRYQADQEFDKVYDNINMNCMCSCDGSYRCQGESVRIVILCTGNSCNLVGCRSCIVDGREHASGSDYFVDKNRQRQRCRCECDGTSTCRDDRPVCTQCVIDGVTYPGHSRHRVYRNGDPYICDCFCSGRHECNLEGPRCRECDIFGTRYPGNQEFDAVVQNTAMKCRCECSGSFECTGGGRVCTSAAGCRSMCQQCNIFGTRFPGDQTFDTVVQGTPMQCTCDCAGNFECKGGGRICTSATGCRAVCEECNIFGTRFPGDRAFDTVVQGTPMQCTCDCVGNFECKGGGRICTSATGCRAVCEECNIFGTRFTGNQEFDTVVQGTAMKCKCDCAGNFECSGGGRVCTSAAGCKTVCQECNIFGTNYAGDQKFEAVVRGTPMRCSCDCSGAFECRGGGQICTTLAGCQPDPTQCQQCNIFGTRFPGNQNFDTIVQGTPMKCRCDCSGNFECRGGGQICTTLGGCRPDPTQCQDCNIFGQRFGGNTNFDTIVQGTQMACTCDCSGNFVCKGGGKVCTTANGCIDDCPGCLIEGITYQGNTNFDIFHKGYGINMNCNCECGGSYKCKGTKQITEPCPGGDCSNTCFDCTVGGRRYRGNSVFETVLDGIQMRCTCHCTGGYKCEGKVTSTTVCSGPQCLTGCQDCRLEGKTYPSNTEFEIDHQGIRMECSCACNGTLQCKGERRENLCIGAGCAATCQPCNFNGVSIPGNSRFQSDQNGVRQLCDCDCNGRLTCNTRGQQCTGPGCQTTGCRRCIIDNIPYSGNTRFMIRKKNTDMNCTCFCDGTFSCRATNGFEFSCLGDECPADQCRACELDGLDYQLDDKFRLMKNDLEMNCVCECDGAYRCFSISGYCTGPDCDDYGCSSCIIGKQTFRGNSRFELKPGTTCECDCNGEYKCNSTSLGFQCVGSECGIGSCKSCLVDNDRYTGNSRFQFKKYGLFMQCACNCDSTFTCRGYQIISDGSSNVDIPCVPCEINGKKYNPLTRFQTMIEGERKVCSCNCRGQHSCQAAGNQCRTCTIGTDEYQPNSDFSLYRGSYNIRCRCNCNGDFVCEGQGTCQGPNCDDGCRDCLIYGTRHEGGTRFYTGNDPQLLCECSCTGDFVCKGYREVTKVILAPEAPDVTCASCYVANEEHPGNTNFKVRRGCYVIDCSCGCDGEWECPAQKPQFVCNGTNQGGLRERVYYSVAGTVGSVNEPIQFGNTKTTIVYRDETSSSIFGSGSGQDCAKCLINNQQFDGNTAFVLQDGCLRWSCLCKCSGGWDCSSVVATDCTGPLDPFKGKSCYNCNAFGNSYPPEKAFTASDECYQYSCMCNCDGSYECPPEQTVKTCPDTSAIFDPAKGTCRQCVIGNYKYNEGDRFEYVYDCLRYLCTCKCDGEYFCPASTAVRVCRSGSGSAGRLVTSGSQTAANTPQTFVALKPVGAGSASSSVSTRYSGTGTRSGVATGSASSYSSAGGSFYATGRSQTSSGGRGSQGRRTGISSGGYSNSTGSGSTYGQSSTYVETTKTKTSSSSSRSSQSGSSQSGSYQTGSSQSGRYQSGSYQSGSSQSGSSQSGSVDLSGLLKSSSCLPCVVNNETLPGGRDFTYREGCLEFLCECSCDGKHTCPASKTVNICDKGKGTGTVQQENNGCTIGNRTYKTQLFSFIDECIKYTCRCYKNGSYYCDPNKSKKVC